MIEKKQKILIVDDSEMNRSILSEMLGEEYEILEACNGTEAVNCLRRHSVELSLVLLDVVMPKIDGLQVLSMMNSYKWIHDIPVIMISAESDSEFIRKAYDLGATDYIQRPFDVTIVQRRAANAIMLYAKQKKLVSLVEEQLYEKQKESVLFSNILNHVVSYRSGESDLHLLRVRKITGILLQNLLKLTDKYSLTPQDISLIVTASALHDVGKIAIEDEKSDCKSEEDMKRHTGCGVEILEQIPFTSNEPLLRVAKEICRAHHERYDGKGYPNGLKGDDIPISAQVVALAEVYDELTGDEKGAISHYDAVEKIAKGNYGVFNPILIEVLKYSSEQIRYDLHVHFSVGDSRKDIERVMLEAISHKGLAASQRTLDLLEREREKYLYIASTYNDIIFEVYHDPSMLTFLSDGAKHFGVESTVPDPLNNENLIACVGEKNLKALADKLRAATIEDSTVSLECKIKRGGKAVPVKIEAKALFTYNDAENKYVFESAIGKIEELNQKA